MAGGGGKKNKTKQKKKNTHTHTPEDYEWFHCCELLFNEIKILINYFFNQNFLLLFEIEGSLDLTAYQTAMFFYYIERLENCVH